MDHLLSFSLNRGDWVFLFGVFSMCCYSISMKWLYRNDEMVVLVFCNFVAGSIWMTLALLISGQPWEWNLIQGPSVFYMAYLVLGATVATVYLFQKSTVALGPNKVMAYTYLNPAAIALMSSCVNNASIDRAIIPGIGLSLLATVLLQFGGSRVPIKKAYTKDQNNTGTLPVAIGH